MRIKIPTFEEYKLKADEPTIELTIEATGGSREEVMLTLKKLDYRLDYPRMKKREPKR